MCVTPDLLISRATMAHNHWCVGFRLQKVSCSTYAWCHRDGDHTYGLGSEPRRLHHGARPRQFDGQRQDAYIGYGEGAAGPALPAAPLPSMPHRTQQIVPRGMEDASGTDAVATRAAAPTNDALHALPTPVLDRAIDASFLRSVLTQNDVSRGCFGQKQNPTDCLLYTSPSPRD